MDATVTQFSVAVRRQKTWNFSTQSRAQGTPHRARLGASLSRLPSASVGCIRFAPLFLRCHPKRTKMTLNTSCPHCTAPIEYDHEDAGKTAECPGCQGEMTLPNKPHVPDAFTKPAEAPKKRSFLKRVLTHKWYQPVPVSNIPPLPRKKKASKVSVFLLSVFGIGLIFSGCASAGAAKNAMNEIYGAVQFCAGFIVLGLAMVVDSLANLFNK